MPIALTDRATRGESGNSPFAVAWEDDLKLSHISVDDTTERDAIPEWKRLPKMKVYSIADDTTFQLGNDTTIAGQVWTDIGNGDLPDNVVLEEDIFDGNGQIQPQLIGNVFLNSSYVVSDEAAMLALSTVTGNFVIRLDGGVYVKLNNDDPSDVSDFAELTYPGTVLSVNSNVGNVVITLADLIAADTAGFNTSVAATATIVALDAAVTTAESDISTIQTTLDDKADLVLGIVPLAQLPYSFANGLTDGGSGNISFGGTLASNTIVDGVDTYSLEFSGLTGLTLGTADFVFNYSDGVNAYDLGMNDANGLKYTTPPASLSNYSLIYKQYVDQNILGSTLSDPNADRLLFWDDSAGQVAWLTAGTGLSISGTTINATIGTIGAAKQIPFVNNGATDFAYSTALLEWDDSKRRLAMGSGLNIGSSPASNFSIIMTENSTISSHFSWSIMVGDEHTLNHFSFNDSQLFGWRHTITGSGGFGGFVSGDNHTITCGTSFNNSNFFTGSYNSANATTGINNTCMSGFGNQAVRTGSVNWAWIGGSTSTGANDGVFVFGYPIANQSTRRIIASGLHAVNISANSSSQTLNDGALADYCFILGGFDHGIPSNATGSGILGGDTIKASSGVINTIYLPRVRFGLGNNASLTTDNSNTNILTRNSTTGEIELRDASTFWVTTGTTTITGNIIVTEDSTANRTLSILLDDSVASKSASISMRKGVFSGDDHYDVIIKGGGDVSNFGTISAGQGATSLNFTDGTENPFINLTSEGITIDSGGSTLRVRDLDGITVNVPLGLASYTVASLPDAATYPHSIVYVSDEVGGPVIAFSDGTDWRRSTDRNVVTT